MPFSKKTKKENKADYASIIPNLSNKAPEFDNKTSDFAEYIISVKKIELNEDQKAIYQHAQEFYKEGLKLYEEKNYKGALERLDTSLQTASKLPEFDVLT